MLPRMRDLRRKTVRRGALVLVAALAGCTSPDPLDTLVPLTRMTAQGPDQVGYGPFFSIGRDRIGLQFRLATKRKPPSGERFAGRVPNVVELTDGAPSVAPAAVAKIRQAIEKAKFDVKDDHIVHVVPDRATTVKTLRVVHAGIGLAGITRSKIVMGDLNDLRTATTVHPFSRLALLEKGSGQKTVLGLKELERGSFVASISNNGAPFEAVHTTWKAMEGERATKCPLPALELAALATALCRRSPDAEVAIDLPDTATVEDVVKVAKVFREAACSPPVTLLSRSGGASLLGAVTCDAKAASGDGENVVSTPTPVSLAKIPGWKPAGDPVIEGLGPKAAKAVALGLAKQDRAVFGCVPAPPRGQTLVSVQIAPQISADGKSATPKVSVAQAPGVDEKVRACIQEALAPIAPDGNAYRVARVWVRTRPGAPATTEGDAPKEKAR